MDSSQTPSSILDTLRTVEFRLGLKGYNVDEVDEYLDKAAQEAEGLQEHVRQLNDRLRQASERIAQLEREKKSAPAAESDEGSPATQAEPALSDETLQRTLILAQKFVDQTKRESEAEAAAIITSAEETAQASIAAAEATAAQLQAESNQRLRDEVARLEATRTELATDVESMARHLESERNRLRSTLSDLLSWVDENVQPANSLMGVKKPAEPKPAPSAGEDSLPLGGDAGPPTMSLPNTTGAAVSGAHRSV
jgi:DivIVA domain-containing protein